MPCACPSHRVWDVRSSGIVCEKASHGLYGVPWAGQAQLGRAVDTVDALESAAELAFHRSGEDLDAVVVADGLQAALVLGETTEGDRGVLLRSAGAVVCDREQRRHQVLHREYGKAPLVACAVCGTQTASFTL